MYLQLSDELDGMGCLKFLPVDQDLRREGCRGLIYPWTWLGTSTCLRLWSWLVMSMRVAKLPNWDLQPQNNFFNNHQDIEMDKNCSSFSTLNLTAHSVTRLRRAQSPFEGHRQSFPGEHRQPVDPEPDSQWCFWEKPDSRHGHGKSHLLLSRFYWENQLLKGDLPRG